MLNNKGFSLVEIVVVVGLMSVIMTLLMTMMSNSSRGFEKQNAAVEVQNEAQIIVNYLSETVMEATYLNFIIEDETTGAGRYEFFETDAEGKAIGKGDMRYLYYINDPTNANPEKRYLLYMVTFNAGEVPPDSPTGADSDNIYLISNEMTEFSIDFDKVEIPKDPPDPLDPDAKEYAIKNLVNVQMTFKLAHNGASNGFQLDRDAVNCVISKFELDVNCRNRLNGAKVTKNGTTVEYKAVNR